MWLYAQVAIRTGGVPTVVPIVGHLPSMRHPANGKSLCFQSVHSGDRNALSHSVQQQVNIEKAATDLYWLAFLLTGRPDISIDIAADAAVAEDNENLFFADWMRNWQRRLVVAKALTAIHDELADSARQTEIAAGGDSRMPRNWSLSPDTTKADLERALLAIDLFPRAALLLLVFEGVRIADAATLLDGKPELLKKAQAIGLRELTANLAATKRSAEGAKSFFDSMRTAVFCW